MKPAFLGVTAVLLVARIAAAQPKPEAAASASSPDSKQLDDMLHELTRFENATKNYRGAIKHIVQQVYTAKRRELLGRYQAQIDTNETEVKARRASAIAMFESFLQRYPEDPRWAPDAMFRLAELYFEKANDEYLAASAATTGTTPTPDYQKTVNLYRELIERFPRYRLIDGAYYLMGWCLGEMNRDRESLQAMRALVCANRYRPLDPPAPRLPNRGVRGTGRGSTLYDDCTPVKKDSRFLPEAWTRIGEFHFDNSELDHAIAAYSRVLNFRDSPYFDKALYKLAWAYYRADNYPDAVKRFDELVVYSDKKKAESGAEGSDLRAEAIQYLGISFAEKDWNGDGVPDEETGLERAKRFYAGREKEPHAREVFAKLGDIYFDETEFALAIQVYKVTLDKWPFDPGNPKLQDRVVTAFERQRDFGRALVERDTLARNYLKGTPWYEHNRDNKEALAAAAELAELALISAAVNHHKAAQDLKRMAAAKHPPDPQLLEQISREYATAAAAYEKYLEQYPNSKNTYEYSYSYAETLYYSGRFLDAGVQYEKVRDSALDVKYMEDAAFNAIKSYEKELQQETQKGLYKEPPLPAEGLTSLPVTPIPVSENVARLQRSYDAFVRRIPASGRVPTLTYKAAEIDYRFLRWDQARPRLEAIVQKFCKEDVGADAGNAIIVSYTIEKNLDKVEEWANRMKVSQCGSALLAQKNTAELGKLSLGVKFKKADQLFAQKRFEEAAAMYVQIVDSDPKAEDADKALNNAAVAYENANRYGAAVKLFERIVNEYPTSKFLDEALFRTAVSYQKFFEYDKAVVSYQRLAEDRRFADSPHRTEAMYNAALILENDQSYAKAAELFKRYAADKNVKREDASEAFFRAALNYEKLRQLDRENETLREYIRTYGTDPKGSQRNLEAYFRMGRAFELMRDRQKADEMYRKTVQLGSAVAPASETAEFPAHAAFILAEEQLPAMEAAHISGGGKKLAASIQAYKSSVENLVEQYNKVLTYRRATWTLAAYFRTGYLFELFSKALLGAPCPPEVKKLGPEACDVYRDQIEQTVAGVDEEAVKRYTITLQKAGELGVSNEWTRLARTRANAYKPDVFPMVKDERIEMRLENP